MILNEHFITYLAYGEKLAASVSPNILLSGESIRTAT